MSSIDSHKTPLRFQEVINFFYFVMKQVQVTQNNDRCNAVYLQIYQHKQTHILLSYVVTLRSSLHTNTRSSRCHYPKYSFLTQPCTGVRSGDGGRVPRSSEGTSPRFDSSICSRALESSQMMTGWSAEVTSESESAARSAMSSAGLVLEVGTQGAGGCLRLGERSALRLRQPAPRPPPNRPSSRPTVPAPPVGDRRGRNKPTCGGPPQGPTCCSAGPRTAPR